MPRIYTSASDPLDFCLRHFPKTETIAETEYGDVDKYGEAPDDRGNAFDYDAEHPDYEDTDYTCEICNKRLTAEDNDSANIGRLRR